VTSKITSSGPRHTYLLNREQWVPKPQDQVFDFFSNPRNLQALTPDWINFRILEAPTELKQGSLIRYVLRWGIIPIRWKTEITEWNPPHRFVDDQISGPYVLWRHEHQFSALGEGTMVRDHVEYALPLWPASIPVHRLIVRKDLERIFDYRAQRLMELLGGKPSRSMAIAKD
jgi:ligand-binding SRPBCC domain-containing protein